MPGEAEATNTYPAASGRAADQHEISLYSLNEFHLLASTANSPQDAEEGEHSVPSTSVPPSYLGQATFELRQS